MACLLQKAFILCLVVALVASRRCCPDDEVMLTIGRRCSESFDYKGLNCSVGKHIFNPETNPNDNFIVLEDDSLDILNGYIVDPEEYCLTKLVYKNGTETHGDVAFLCIPDQGHSTTGIMPNSTRHLVMGVLIFISVAFMMLTIVVYVALPAMRDIEGKCLLMTVISFAIAFSMLGALRLLVGNLVLDAVCEFSAFFLYFWMLSAFFWMNVVAFNLWKSVMCPSTSHDAERRLFIKYCTYGWGCPLVFLLTAILMHHLPAEYELLRPEFGWSKCWFHGRQESWLYFYGPVAGLIGCNIIFFVWTAWKLWRDYRDQTEVKLPSLRFKCVLYVKLLFVMGIPWTFELFAIELDSHGDSYFWFATDLLNGLSGVLIFLITVVCRKRVLKALRQHRSFGINWPKKWASVEDEESLAILPNSDIEMSAAQVAAKILS